MTKRKALRLAYLALISSSSLCSRSSFNSSSDASEGFCNRRGFGFDKRELFVFPVCKVWWQGTTSIPRGCCMPMWRRQSGQVNRVVFFCPPCFLLGSHQHIPLWRSHLLQVNCSLLFPPSLLPALRPYISSLCCKCAHGLDIHLPTICYFI